MPQVYEPTPYAPALAPPLRNRPLKQSPYAGGQVRAADWGVGRPELTSPPQTHNNTPKTPNCNSNNTPETCHQNTRTHTITP